MSLLAYSPNNSMRYPWLFASHAQLGRRPPGARWSRIEPPFSVNATTVNPTTAQTSAPLSARSGEGCPMRLTYLRWLLLAPLISPGQLAHSPRLPLNRHQPRAPPQRKPRRATTTCASSSLRCKRGWRPSKPTTPPSGSGTSERIAELEEKVAELQDSSRASEDKSVRTADCRHARRWPEATGVRRRGPLRSRKAARRANWIR